jgi:hypothetical protein
MAPCVVIGEQAAAFLESRRRNINRRFPAADYPSGFLFL